VIQEQTFLTRRGSVINLKTALASLGRREQAVPIAIRFLLSDNVSSFHNGVSFRFAAQESPRWSKRVRVQR
jgi:hypothetical protein